MYLATFQALKEQAAGQVPQNLLETWLGGAASMCLALAQMDDEVTGITYKLMLDFFRQTCNEI
jgi:hypothetical protein